MHKVTQTEFDSIERRDGLKLCPQGDYSNVKVSGKKLIFPESCIFSAESVFGIFCSFGDECVFSGYCKFAGWCKFGRDCSFGCFCKFGDYCGFALRGDFDEGCTFGIMNDFSDYCTFRDSCDFAKNCIFGESNSFGKGCCFDDSCHFTSSCIYESGHVAKTGFPYLAFAGCSYFARKTYFWNFTDGIYVRSGWFFGTLAEFKARAILYSDKGPTTYIAMMGFIDLAEKIWASGPVPLILGGDVCAA